MGSPKKLAKALKDAGFVVLKETPSGTLWTGGTQVVQIPKKSDVRARTENKVRKAVRKAGQ